jgi:hypothetical protein
MSVDQLIEEFTLSISKTYKIQQTELKILWNTLKSANSGIDNASVLSTGGLKESAKAYSRIELIELCKLGKLKCSGTKDELFNRLKNDSKNKSVIKKIASTNISIKENKFGNHTHEETGFVFNKNKKVYGRENPDGTIVAISKDDIDICNKYKFEFEYPLNLDTTSTNSGKKSGEDDSSSNLEDIENDFDDDEDELEEEEELEA